MGPEFLEGVLVGSEKWIEAGGKKIVGREVSWKGKYHCRRSVFWGQCYGREIREGGGACIKENTNIGEIWLLTIYKPLPCSNKCKFKKYTYYRNFSKGIDNPEFSIIKESKHLGCGQMLGKIFGTFWLFWTKLPSLDLSESLMGGCKSKPFLAFYKWNHYPLSLGNLVWWGSRRLTVVTWVKGLCSGAGLLWCGYTVDTLSPVAWCG